MSRDQGFIKSNSIGSEAADFSPRVSLLLALTYLASSLTLPFILAYEEKAATIASYAVLMLCAVVLFISAKKTSHAVWLTVLAIFLSCFVGSPILPALIFGTVIGIACASALFCSKSGVSLAAVLCSAAGSYAICFVVSKDPVLSLFAFAILIPAFFFALSTKKKMGLTASVAICGGLLSLAAALILVYRMHALYGSIDLKSLSLAADSFIDAFMYYVKLAMVKVYELEITPAIHTELLGIAESFVNLSPGLVIACGLTLAYFSHNARKNLFYSYGLDEYLSPEATLLTVSVPAAVIFLIAYLLSFATSAEGGLSLVAIVGNNVAIMLIPCLILKGFTALKAIPLRLGFLGLLISGGIIIFILSSPSAPSLLALVGAFFVLIVSIDRWAKDHFGKGENQ